MTQKPTVTVTWISPDFARYFDWLIAGLGQLGDDGHCNLQFDLSGLNQAMCFAPFRYLSRRLASRSFYEYDAFRYYMRGTVALNGKSTTFVYDIWDAPYHFYVDELNAVDIYFKAQFPIDLPERFQLSRESSVALPPQALTQCHKIRRAMLGRPLAKSINWRKNIELLKGLESLAKEEKTSSLFAYFGDYSDQHRLPVHRHGGRQSDPKAKRAEVVRILREMKDPQVDARVVKGPDSTLLGPPIKSLPEFMKHVARSCFNVNVSGLERSLPFRFPDSFMVGTSVVSDAIGIEFYRPFLKDIEVFDLGPLGYELWEDVDFASVSKALAALKADAFEHSKRHRQTILDRYHSIWSPRAFASYFLNECLTLH